MNNLEVTYSDELRARYPTASMGILVFGFSQGNAEQEELANHTSQVIDQLKNKFVDSAELKNDPVIGAYSNYYKPFKKTYHVLPQLESVVFKGRSLNLPIPLLQIIFLSELKNKLLTAVHDMAEVEPPVSLDLSSGEETYSLLNGSQKMLKPEDMFAEDKKGVISSIIYGPDFRTRISKDTNEAMVVVYAPPGINRSSIAEHFDSIHSLSEAVSIDPEIHFREIFPKI